MLLRKNVSTEQIFNMSFLVLLVSLFCGRVVFIGLHPSASYLNPLVFFLFFYFPGMSLIGGITGGILFLCFYAFRKKMPYQHIADIFSMAFVWSITIANLLLEIVLLLSRKFSLSQTVVTILFIIGAEILHTVFARGNVKDGKVSLFALFLFSSVSLIDGVITHIMAKKSVIDANNIFLLVIFLIISFLLIKPQKDIISFRRK